LQEALSYWTELGKRDIYFVRDSECLDATGRWCGEMQFVIRGMLDLTWGQGIRRLLIGEAVRYAPNVPRGMWERIWPTKMSELRD
jgi:hypothetical protein